MPTVYLDPSTNENIEFVGGGTEEELMNLIADALVPYLGAMGIMTARNDPGDTETQAIDKSNAGNYDLHLSLRAFPRPPEERGENIYYFTYREEAERIAFYIARSLKTRYPMPDLVTMIPTIEPQVLRRTRAVSVLSDLGNSKNEEDAQWIRDNIFLIARRLMIAIGLYFGILQD